MEKNDILILVLLFFVPSVLLAEIISQFVERVYRKNADLLSFDAKRIPKLRRPFLTLAIFICAALLFTKTTGMPIIPFVVIAPFENALPRLVALLCLFPAIVLLLVIAVTDWEHQMIFNDTTLPLAILGLIQTIAISCATTSYAPLLKNLTAAVIGGLCFLILAILSHGGIGGGDIKLIAALGIWLGPARLTTVVCTGFLLGGFAAIFFLIVKRKKQTDTFAYGPYFALPAIFYLLANPI